MLFSRDAIRCNQKRLMSSYFLLEQLARLLTDLTRLVVCFSMKGPVIVLRGSCLLRIFHYICLNDEKGSFSRLFCMIVEGNNNMIDANKVC